MTWFAWRLFRTQAWIAAGLLAAFGAALLITGMSLADAYEAAGAAACDADCSNALRTFLHEAKAGASGTVYELSLATVYLVPALIGAFWGAPLVAREVETGTHRLAWNQSVPRTRWLAGKLAVGGAATVAVAGALSVAVTAWASDIDAASGDRVAPLVYGARGIVPVAYALFAFALGAAVGMLLRRTVPAMAATLGAYGFAVAAMPMWVRAHLTPPERVTTALEADRLMSLMMDTDGGMIVLGEGTDGGWELHNRTLAADGQVFTGPAHPESCGRESIPGQCEEWLGTLGLRQDLAYHPDSHFWALQWAETGIFAGAAALLVGFCFWRLRRLA